MKPVSLKSLNTTTLVVVPVKSLVFAKSRLASILTADKRTALALNLLHNTLANLLAVFSNITVLTADTLVAELATNLGVQVFVEDFQARPNNANLNKSLCQTLQSLELPSAIKSILIIPADLPFLSVADLEDLNSLALNVNPASIIVPDKHGRGTNGLLVPVSCVREFEFHFGENSFSQHLEEFAKLSLEYQICQPSGLVFDLDTPADFAALPSDLQNALLSNSVNHLYTKISTING